MRNGLLRVGWCRTLVPFDDFGWSSVAAFSLSDGPREEKKPSSIDDCRLKGTGCVSNTGSSPMSGVSGVSDKQLSVVSSFYQNRLETELEEVERLMIQNH